MVQIFLRMEVAGIKKLLNISFNGVCTSRPSVFDTRLALISDPVQEIGRDEANCPFQNCSRLLLLLLNLSQVTIYVITLLSFQDGCPTHN